MVCKGDQYEALSFSDRPLLSNRQAPLGNEKWQVDTATKHGMLSTLNERGRPRKDV